MSTPSTSTQTCPTEMHQGQACGRPLYLTNYVQPPDPVPVCLMHSLDPAKDDTQFQQEFEGLLASAIASNTIADFTRFVFNSANYPGKHFAAPCVFYGAVFSCPADFRDAIFDQEANFDKVTFGTKTNPDRATFHHTHFRHKTHFIGTTFWGEAFFDAIFGRSIFESTESEEMTAFITATFKKRAVFVGAIFCGVAQFKAKFKDEADFLGAVFRKETSFNQTTFFKDVSFRLANFQRDVGFNLTTFTLAVYFEGAKFFKQADFFQARFRNAVAFRNTQFLQDTKSLPSLVFKHAEITLPDAIVFYKVNLSQALFYNCDVSALNFSSVDWGTRSNGKRRLFEECVDVNEGFLKIDPDDSNGSIHLFPKNLYSTNLRTRDDDPNERDYGLIAETYQQLKKNYDNRQDYWTAGDFHYGEMEMKRLHSPRKNKVVRWLHSNLGLIAWYRYASEYGESYVRPLLALVVVLALFTLLFPIPGLVFTKPDSASIPTPPPFSTLIYRNLPAYIHVYPGPKWIAILAFFGNSLMTALSVAGFQKELIYQPAYPWGRALALFELLLTSTLIALFLLALRRQFRR